jgi:hypothetical protein
MSEEAKFSGVSVLFDGTGDYLGVPEDDFVLGRTCVIEFWIWR